MSGRATRRGVWAVALVVALVLPVSAQTASVPMMMWAGPYGDPLALRPPASLVALPGGEAWLPSLGGDPPARSASARVPLGEVRDPLKAATKPDDTSDDDEDDAPQAKPGSLKGGPVKIPTFPDVTHGEKRKFLGPRLKPDFEVPITKKATLGVFGEVGKVDIENRTGVIPNVRAHGVGAGLSLEYKFGQ